MWRIASLWQTGSGWTQQLNVYASPGGRLRLLMLLMLGHYGSSCCYGHYGRYTHFATAGMALQRSRWRERQLAMGAQPA